MHTRASGRRAHFLSDIRWYMKNTIIGIIKNILIKHKLEDVFTPAKSAKLAYIKRTSIESDFIKYLTIPGMQIVIYGNSGNGKTTLVTNILRKQKIDMIKTSCTEATTFDQILLDSFDRLGKYYSVERTSKKGYSISQDMAVKYQEISLGRKTTETFESTEKNVRIVPLQLTSQRLAEFMGESKCVWVIEDFHKVKAEEKKTCSSSKSIYGLLK
jgi:hypothetical protein